MDRKLAMDDAPQNFGWILLLTKVPKIHPIWYSHPSLKRKSFCPKTLSGIWVIRPLKSKHFSNNKYFFEFSFPLLIKVESLILIFHLPLFLLLYSRDQKFPCSNKETISQLIITSSYSISSFLVSASSCY